MRTPETILLQTRSRYSSDIRKDADVSGHCNALLESSVDEKARHFRYQQE